MSLRIIALDIDLCPGSLLLLTWVRCLAVSSLREDRCRRRHRGLQRQPMMASMVPSVLKLRFADCLFHHLRPAPWSPLVGHLLWVTSSQARPAAAPWSTSWSASRLVSGTFCAIRDHQKVTWAEGCPMPKDEHGRHQPKAHMADIHPSQRQPVRRAAPAARLAGRGDEWASLLHQAPPSSSGAAREGRCPRDAAHHVGTSRRGQSETGPSTGAQISVASIFRSRMAVCPASWNWGFRSTV